METGIETDQQLAPLRVGIQGYPGAFHHLAAEAFYAGKSIEIKSYHHFVPLAHSVAEENELDSGLMAIENSLAGSLLPNYHLLLNYSLQIKGEIYLRIRQNLMALAGQQMSDLKEVYSHPVAIEQCRPFFADYPHIRLIEAEDTALSALRIQQSNKKGVGAIASELAGRLYNLEVLKPGIESNHQNYTRFLVLGKEQEQGAIFQKPKVSICFSLGHEVGTLAQVLSVLANLGLNLIKIQSVPIHGTPWIYRFFVDFLLPEQTTVSTVIHFLKPEVKEFRFLGIYEAGNHIQ
ncbi:MAG: prephenate dehydratase [Saprospiraceae bacterium]|nr:prephenate dehydratase [Saprospiraceae bacterium]